MKKGIKVEVVKRILDDCRKVGISFHLYIIIGFPTETEKEALETLNFVLNKEYLDLPGFSCLPSLFGMEQDSPITQNPLEYGLRSIMAPGGEDLGLWYFYEVEQGMSSEEAERMYHYAVNYNSVSFEMDDIIWLYDIPIIQSQSNAGSRSSRPLAWAKDIFSIGAVNHYNTAT